jgi:hypothetical protein
LVLHAWAMFAFCEQWHIADSSAFYWDDSTKQFIFLAELPKGWTDAGDFLRVRIKNHTGGDFKLENRDGWVKLNPKYSYSKSLFNDKHFILSPIRLDGSEKALILTGYGYASDASRLDIITLYNGTPELTRTMDHFDILKIEDINHDSVNEVIGQKWLGEVYGKDNVFHSYCPYFVYRYSKNNDHWQFVFDLALTRDYNVKNYYGWRGTNPTEDYVVVHPKDGSKPRIMKMKDAIERYGSHAQDTTLSPVPK